MPILKQLVSHSNASKRRSRADLTAEMISAPLGDFRHTMHVGRGGDAFGDTTFLSTRSGEPPRETTTTASQPDHHHHHNPPNKQDSPGGGGGPKLGLLSRTFRSSKRSQSVNRGDKYDSNLILPSTGGGSASYVKNAISLPYLNDEDTGRGVRLAKSVSSSPMRKLSEADGGGGGGIRPANGGGAMAAMATLDAEFDEHNFGELTDLPPSMPRGGGMKHAESIMSFHIDLGPSMLGDILSVMEKKGWEEDDLGYEEGKGSEGRGSPSLSPPAEDEDVAPARPPRSMVYQQQQKAPVDPYTPELRVRGSSTTTNQNQNQSQSQNQYLDSCSVSSSGSAALDEQKAGHHHNNNNHHHHHTGGGEEGGDTDSAKYSSPRGEDERDFSFMDEDDDEIRV